jgi:hypothetical protein
MRETGDATYPPHLPFVQLTPQHCASFWHELPKLKQQVPLLHCVPPDDGSQQSES